MKTDKTPDQHYEQSDDETLTDEQRKVIIEAAMCHEAICQLKDAGMTNALIIAIEEAVEHYCKEHDVCYRDAWLGRYDDD